MPVGVRVWVLFCRFHYYFYWPNHIISFSFCLCCDNAFQGGKAKSEFSDPPSVCKQLNQQLKHILATHYADVKQGEKIRGTEASGGLTTTNNSTTTVTDLLKGPQPSTAEDAVSKYSADASATWSKASVRD